MLNTNFLNKTQLKIKNKIFYFILLDRTRFNVFSFEPDPVQLEQ
jgi:hypothetical protein